MSTTKHILREIDTDAVGNKCEYPSMIIRENYILKNKRPQSFGEVKDELTKYYQMHMSVLQNVQLPADTAYGSVKEILNKKYSGGADIAARNAIRGREGGLMAVIDVVVEGIISKAVDEYITWVLDTYINPLNWNEKLAFAKEYLEEFTEVLIGDDHMCAEELAAHIDVAFKFHATWMKGYKMRLQS